MWLLRFARPDRRRSVPSATLGEQVFGRGVGTPPDVLGRVFRLMALPARRWFVVVLTVGAVAIGLLIGLGLVADRASSALAADGERAGAAPLTADAAVAQVGAGGALVTLLNPGSTARTVTLQEADDMEIVGLPSSVRVEPADTRSFVVEVGSDPVTFTARCSGCRTVVFAVADGQRIIVIVLGVFDEGAETGALRGDVHVVNESGRRQTGSLRTGDVMGLGLSLLRFDLAPNASMSVGVRVAALQTVDLNLTCSGCAPQLARVSNGVDLEIVLR